MNLEQKFTDKSTARIWKDYFTRVTKAVRLLGRKQKQDLLRELENHLYESFLEGKADSEVENLLNAIEKLGVPEEYLQPMVSRELLVKGTQTFSPITLFKGLYFNVFTSLRNAITSIGFGVGYLFAIIFLIMPFAKLIAPESVGYFVYADGSWGFGIFSDTQGANDPLGYWIIPLGIFASVLLHFSLTKLLKLTMHKR